MAVRSCCDGLDLFCSAMVCSHPASRRAAEEMMDVTLTGLNSQGQPPPNPRCMLLRCELATVDTLADHVCLPCSLHLLLETSPKSDRQRRIQHSTCKCNACAALHARRQHAARQWAASAYRLTTGQCEVEGSV